MSGMSFIGSYSGIDKNTIDQLMAAEKMPLVQLTNKKTTITEKQNAWKDINTRLNSLLDKVKGLQSKGTFNTKISTSTNDKIVSMVAGENAISGTYNINVKQLATSTNIIFDTIGTKKGNENLGVTGSFTIKNEDFDINNPEKNMATISINDGDSLDVIATNINDNVKQTGISASVINNRLVLTDTKTGKRNIQLDDSIDSVGTLANLGLTPTSKTEGVQAEFYINGIYVERDSNKVSDVLNSVTINLTKTHIGTETDTVTVAPDNTVVEKAVKEFVDQYNSTMTFIEDKLKAGDPEVEGSKGTLSGDSSLMRLHSTLRNLVTSISPNSNASIKEDISKLGVTTVDKFGQLTFDSSKLTKALAEDPQKVMNFFSSKDLEGNEIGFAPRLLTYIDSFSSTSKGLIKGKTESFDRSLKDLTKQIDNFSARMIKKEAYYVKMFTALDVALMKAESQMSWLQGQVDSMNGIKK